jgi:coenzyme F420-reducing hydrogenase gamma subunit
MKNKITIGLFSLTGCEGCYFATLDLREKFLQLETKLEFKNFRLFEEHEATPEEKFDIACVEGSPLTKENVAKLKKIRKNSNLLVAFGGCAHMGGIYHLKQYTDNEKSFNHVYGSNVGIDNLEVKPISKIVKIDATIPGCPVNGEEVLDVMHALLLGKKKQPVQNPVCYECQVNGYECLLQKGEICLGPITQGGCKAICLKSKQACWGCRGLVEDAEVGNLVKKLREK